MNTDPAPLSHANPNRSISTARLLIVEDDPDIASLVSLFARRAIPHVQITQTDSVDEAVALIEGGAGFDFVLADFMLADSRNGYELRDLCSSQEHPCKFAMMSSMPLDFPELGENGFLQKPFTPNEAERFIERSFAR